MKIAGNPVCPAYRPEQQPESAQYFPARIFSGIRCCFWIFFIDGNGFMPPRFYYVVKIRQLVEVFKHKFALVTGPQPIRTAFNREEIDISGACRFNIACIDVVAKLHFPARGWGVTGHFPHVACRIRTTGCRTALCLIALDQ